MVRIIAGVLAVVVALITGLAVGALGALLCGLFMWLLWNWLMPDIFGLVEITYWQAVGLCFLTSMLFKSGSSNSKSD